MAALPGRRGTKISVPKWWLDLLNAALEAVKAGPRQLTQEDVARLVKRYLGFQPAGSTISRCKDGKITTIELVSALSAVLRLPRPVYFAKTEDEARWMETQLNIEHELDPDGEVPVNAAPNIKPTPRPGTLTPVARPTATRQKRVARSR